MEVGQRVKDEEALVQAGVGEDEALSGYADAVDEEQVDVDDTGLIANSRAFPTELALDGLGLVEKIEDVTCVVGLDDRVEKVRCAFWATDGFSLVEWCALEIG